MLKKIKILLFITITALVLPGIVHADMSTYNNVCISPGSPCAGRIADLENQYAKHIKIIADLQGKLAAEPDPALGIQCCQVKGGRFVWQPKHSAAECR
tara:strand:+ start:278 stop:571 length:294 start_codon:yes stop_codon:yes gene_type:complete